MITKQILHSSISGEIDQVEVSGIYKLGLTLIAIIMVLLPILYLALIVLAGIGVSFFAKNPFNVFSSDLAGVFQLVLYAAPVVSSACVAVFMVKPLFKRLQKPKKGLKIVRNQEPVLFELIDLVCNKVNAPTPKQVFLNSEANAAASFGSDLKSFAKGELDLIIGLPLVTSLSASQFAGILAHEFGHFSQGAGMRISFLVRSINNWFFRVVFERDKLDEKINQWGNNTSLIFAAILGVARLSIWISRKILYGFMLLGNLISGFMLRQMEYDADRYEIRFSGSKEFIKTTNDLRLLSLNWAIMHQNIFENWSSKNLTDNIPYYLAHKFNQKDNALLKSIDNDNNEPATSFFDTHPSDKERIRNAITEDKEGVFSLDLPASQLFKDLETISKKCTVLLYQTMMAEDFREDHLVSLNEFIEKDLLIEQNDSALNIFFNGAINVHFPIGFGKFEKPERGKDPLNELKSVQEFLHSNSQNITNIIDLKYNILETYSNLTGAHLIIKSGNKVKTKEFGLKTNKLSEVKRRLKETSTEEANINLEYEAYRKEIVKIPFLLQDILQDERKLDRISSLIDLEDKFFSFYPALRELMKNYDRFLILAINLDSLGQDNELASIYQDSIYSVKSGIKNAYNHFYESASIFNENIIMAKVLIPDGINSITTENMPETFQTFVNLYMINYCRILGEFGVMASEQLDTGLG